MLSNILASDFHNFASFYNFKFIKNPETLMHKTEHVLKISMVLGIQNELN